MPLSRPFPNLDDGLYLGSNLISKLMDYDFKNVFLTKMDIFESPLKYALKDKTNVNNC